MSVDQEMINLTVAHLFINLTEGGWPMQICLSVTPIFRKGY